MDNIAERVVADMVLDEAQRLWTERTQELIRAIEVAVHNGVATAMGG